MKLAKDKIFHLVAGVVVALIVGTIFKNPLAGLIGGCLAGVVKEAWDYYRNKKEPGSATVDKLDALWTFGGAAVGGIMVALAQAYGTL